MPPHYPYQRPTAGSRNPCCINTGALFWGQISYHLSSKTKLTFTLLWFFHSTGLSARCHWSNQVPYHFSWYRKHLSGSSSGEYLYRPRGTQLRRKLGPSHRCCVATTSSAQKSDRCSWWAWVGILNACLYNLIREDKLDEWANCLIWSPGGCGRLYWNGLWCNWSCSCRYLGIALPTLSSCVWKDLTPPDILPSYPISISWDWHLLASKFWLSSTALSFFAGIFILFIWVPGRSN